MRLLLTRAEADAARTREKLEALGHEVVASPVIEIVGTGASWPSGVIDAAVATSGHAFSVRLDGPTPEVRHLLPLYLVGARTAETARSHDFRGAATVAKNAAALAMEMGKLETSTKRIVYLAGRNRKPDMEETLDVIGHKLELVEVYEARPSDALSHEATQALRHDDIDAILHFSRRSAMLFVEIASKHGVDIRTVPHLCLSEDVARPLEEAGATEVHVAESPNEESLLALLAEASDADA